MHIYIYLYICISLYICICIMLPVVLARCGESVLCLLTYLYPFMNRPIPKCLYPYLSTYRRCLTSSVRLWVLARCSRCCWTPWAASWWPTTETPSSGREVWYIYVIYNIYACISTYTYLYLKYLYSYTYIYYYHVPYILIGRWRCLTRRPSRWSSSAARRTRRWATAPHPSSSLVSSK